MKSSPLGRNIQPVARRGQDFEAGGGDFEASEAAPVAGAEPNWASAQTQNRGSFGAWSQWVSSLEPVTGSHHRGTGGHTNSHSESGRCSCMAEAARSHHICQGMITYSLAYHGHCGEQSQSRTCQDKTVCSHSLHARDPFTVPTTCPPQPRTLLSRSSAHKGPGLPHQPMVRGHRRLTSKPTAPPSDWTGPGAGHGARNPALLSRTRVRGARLEPLGTAAQHARSMQTHAPIFVPVSTPPPWSALPSTIYLWPIPTSVYVRLSVSAWPPRPLTQFLQFGRHGLGA